MLSQGSRISSVWVPPETDSRTGSWAPVSYREVEKTQWGAWRSDAGRGRQPGKKALPSPLSLWVPGTLGVCLNHAPQSYPTSVTPPRGVWGRWGLIHQHPLVTGWGLFLGDINSLAHLASSTCFQNSTSRGTPLADNHMCTGVVRSSVPLNGHCRGWNIFLRTSRVTHISHYLLNKQVLH